MSYSPFRHLGSVFLKRSLIHLTLFLTGRCNSNCPFCFYLAEKDAEGEKRPELSLNEVRKISSSMGKLLWLAFSGGEIFLRDDIVEITKVFYERNRPAIILFPTNGLLTGVIRDRIGEVLKYCKKSTVVVKLSLDGLEGLHDDIRGTKGGFRKTMDTYNALGRFLDEYPNFELGVNTVFCSANQEHMEELIGFVSRLENIRTHTISLIRGAVPDKDLKAVDMEKYFNAVDLLALNLRKKLSATYRFRGAKLKAAQDILQRRLIYETMVRKRQMLPCYAGRLNLVISEKGDVYPCESFTMKLGNIRDDGYDLKEMLRSERSQDIIASIRKNGCYCTHECYFMTNILFNFRMYPKLLKEYVNL